MNDAGREKLVAAAMSGVPQIKGTFEFLDGKCALGVLGMKLNDKHNEEICKEFELGIGWKHARKCPLCPSDYPSYDEVGLIGHYNDLHDMDFLSIARKI